MIASGVSTRGLAAVLLLTLVVAFGESATVPKEWIDEAAGWMIDSIRTDSRSIPTPGTEWTYVGYLKKILDRENITNTVITLNVKSPADGSNIPMPLLFGKIEGSAPLEGVLMLSSHSDTVGTGKMAEEDVLSGRITDDGMIVGRGTADDKQKVVLDLAAIVWTKRLGKVPTRGLLFAVFPGEELGMVGATAAFTSLEALSWMFGVRLAIDEGNGATVRVLDTTLMPISIGEKGACWLDLRTSGSDAHASGYYTKDRMPIVRVADAISAIFADHEVFPRIDSTVVDLMLDELHAAVPLRYKSLVDDLKCPYTYQDAAKRLAEDDVFGARFLIPQLQNTYNAVRVMGDGAPTNVPGVANATIVAMVMPGIPEITCAVAISDVYSRIGGLSSGLQVVQVVPDGMPILAAGLISGGTHVDPNSDSVSQMFNAIVKAAAVYMPDVVPVHSILPAITDCLIFRQLYGIPCMGFSPTRVPADMFYLDAPHSDFERLPMEGFRQGLPLYFDAVSRFLNP